MRRGINQRRPRGGRTGGGRKSQGGGANRNYDSNGPDVRVRGNANQVYEKYCQLARDASATGDRVAAENYLQHAEHYYRIMVANGNAQAATSQANSEPAGPEAQAAAERSAGKAGNGAEKAADSSKESVDPADAPQPSIPEFAFPNEQEEEAKKAKAKAESDTVAV